MLACLRKVVIGAELHESATLLFLLWTKHEGLHTWLGWPILLLFYLKLLKLNLLYLLHGLTVLPQFRVSIYKLTTIKLYLMIIKMHIF